MMGRSGCIAPPDSGLNARARPRIAPLRPWRPAPCPSGKIEIASIRPVGKVARPLARVFQRVVLADQVDRVGKIIVRAAVTDDRVLPELALVLVAAGIGEDHRQGHLALAEVVALILAHFGSVRIVVDRIVDQLEGNAEIAAIGFERALLLFRTFGNHRADLAGGGEERGGLGADDVEVLLFAGVDLALGGELRDLAFRDHRARAG